MVRQKITTISELSELCKCIAKEHFELTKGHNDNIGYQNENINYLWYMYSEGVHSGAYRPFILLAEINLCKYFQLINEEECKNLDSMLESGDMDNTYLVMLIIKKIMKDRHDKFGTDLNHETYTDVRKNYYSKVLSHNLFLKKK